MTPPAMTPAPPPASMTTTHHARLRTGTPPRRRSTSAPPRPAARSAVPKTSRTALAAFTLGTYWTTARHPAAMSGRSDRSAEAP